MRFSNVFYSDIFQRQYPYHQHQFLPGKGVDFAFFIKRGQCKIAFLQFHVVDHQSAVLHVQCFHARAMTVQKDEYVTAAYILSHPLSDQPA